MKKLALLLLTFVSLSSALFAADVAVSGNLTNWAGMRSNYTDFDSDGHDSFGFIYVDAELNTTVELSDNVKVVLQLELNDKVTEGSAGGLSGVGGANQDDVDVDELYVHVGEFFFQNLSLRLGHQYLEYSLRGDGNAMVIGDDFTAVKFTYAFESGFLDAFYGKKFEDLVQGDNENDADIWGLHLEWNFNENIHTIFYANYADMNNTGGDNSYIISLGAGIDAFFLDKKLEVFAELAAQFGEISSAQDHSGFAFDLGAKWNFGEVGSLAGLWVELSIGYRSGQDNDPDSTDFWNGWAVHTDGIIAESNLNDDSPLYAGYANDQYLAIRLEAGAQWTEKIGSTFLLGIYDNTNDNGDAYGIEIDLTTSYQYSENLSMKALVAIFLPDDGLTGGGNDDLVLGAALVTDVSF